MVIGGRYQVVERIARGGQASVWRGRHLQLDRVVALKVLLFSPTLDDADLDSFRMRFRQEARTLAALDHPNIVRVFDHGEFGREGLYIAMEYVDGVTFSNVLQLRPPPARGLRLIHQVCLALRYAHQRGVVHRDIKNSNVMVTRDSDGVECVKVVDFGIAKVTDGEVEITRVGMVLGSPQFMSPEQIQGHPIDHRTDIYALGVLMYCALAGQYPFRGDSAKAIIAGHLMRSPPPFDEFTLPHPIPDGIELVVRRCLEKDPGRRYPHIDALLAELDPWVECTTAGTVEGLGGGWAGADTPAAPLDTLPDQPSNGTLAPMAAPLTGPMGRAMPTPIRSGSSSPPKRQPSWLLMTVVAIVTALFICVLGTAGVALWWNLPIPTGGSTDDAVPAAAPAPHPEAAPAVAAPVEGTDVAPQLQTAPANPQATAAPPPTQPTAAANPRSTPSRPEPSPSNTARSRPSATGTNLDPTPAPDPSGAVQPEPEAASPDPATSADEGDWRVDEVVDPWAE